MTQPFDDEYGDRLRRALHAEAEAVTPSPEGLERIRSKINQRHERRFGFLTHAVPWLRPAMSVAAALAACVVAVSVTPALSNFVQTGHFSPDTGNDSSRTISNDGQTTGVMRPGVPSTPAPAISPSPSSLRPSNTGKHIVTGSCQPGWKAVTPSGTPTTSEPAPGSAPASTCKPVSGGDSSSPPVTENPSTPQVSSPPVVQPTEQPPQNSGPSVAPNQSP